jgi:hypothetical protein
MTTTGRSSSRGHHDPSHAARRQRDAGLERGRTITKGIAAASVAAVAVAGVYLSQALPGHSTSTSTPNSGSAGAVTPADPSAAPSDGSSSSGSSAGSGISTPASAPAPAYQQAPVTSGSS